VVHCTGPLLWQIFPHILFQLSSFYVCQLVWVQWVILSKLRALFASPRDVPHGRVVMKSNTDNHPLSYEHILSVATKFLTHCIGWLQMVVCPPGSKQYCDPYCLPGGVRFLHTDCRITLDISMVLGMTFALRI
jgi:hypothetical protein